MKRFLAEKGTQMVREQRVEDVPLIIEAAAFEGAAYGPISDAGRYIGRLLQKGFTHETLPAEFSDLYALDYYEAQVLNGGHSQFVGNSKENLSETLERALRGARMLGLNKTVALLEECAQWCREHPDEARRQTGFDVRADALEALDKRHWTALDDEEIEALLEELPAALAEALRPRLFAPEGASALVERYIEETLRLVQDMGSEAAAEETLSLLDPLFEWSQCAGQNPRREYFNSYLERFGSDTVALEEELRNRLGRLLTEPLRDNRSRYYLKTWVWIAQHPKLKRLSGEDWAAEVDAVAAQNPGAAQELAARAWDKLHHLIPHDNHMALALLLGQVLQNPVRLQDLSFVYSDPRNSEARENHIIDVSGEQFFLERRKGRTRLRAAKFPRLREAMQRRGFFVVKAGTLRAAVENGLSYLANRPGQVLVEVASDPGLRDLFVDLHIPEAVGLSWPVEGFEAEQQRAHYAQKGIIVGVNRGLSKLTWLLDTDAGRVVFDATPKGVTVTRNGARHFFSRKDLEDYRSRFQRT